MKRTLVQFDEEIYRKLKDRAFKQGRSMASVVRELVSQGLEPSPRKKFKRAKQFSFVGAGQSSQKRQAPISERHDEALADAFISSKKK